MGRAEELLAAPALQRLRGRIALVFTSPPFPLNTKKRYGNEVGDAYIRWLAGFAPLLLKLLTPDGSIVIEVGNSWTQGVPVMSTLALEALLEFKRAAGLHLCQEFVWHNKAKLPTPAEWVTIRRIRVKDSFTKIWWLSPTAFPKADNRRVLVPYSPSMRRLLERGSYNAGRRPSDHVITPQSFLRDNNGAIPPNVLVSSNTRSADPYLDYCRERGARPHPARMPRDVASFFIRFLTDPGDLVLDPFAGSNTTGAVADSLQRRWIAIEADPSFAQLSQGWFKQARSKSLPQHRERVKRR